MSIASEIQRLQTAKENITIALLRAGYDIPSGITLDEYPTYIDPYFFEELTFRIISGGTIVWSVIDTAYTCTIEYKKNDGEWTSITSNTGASAPSISVVAGDIVQFRGDNATYYFDYIFNSFSGTTCCFNVEGNIMSLINSTDFVTATTLASSFTFKNLFNSCTGLTDASNLVLPAITLAQSCYESMFYRCTSLTTVPELPATTLAENCYFGMFGDCTSLTSAPELPATTLANYCYCGMFENCTSLTTAPELPATTLANNCYQGMFRYCSSLTTAPELPATTLEEECYYQMFRGCTNLNYIKCLATDITARSCTNSWARDVASTGTFVKNASMTGWTTGNNGIPTGWTVEDDRDTLTKMPLTFEITSGGVVSWLFDNKSGNGSAKTLEYKVNNGSWTEITSTTGGTTFNVSSGDTVQFRGDNMTLSYSSTTMHYRNEFSGTTAIFNVKGNVMSLLDKNNFENKTTFDPDSQFVFFFLFNCCTGLTSAKNLILPATALTDSCYRSMFNRCTSLTAAPELPVTTLTDGCYQNMFNNCTSLTTAPELPATTLANYCYYGMFANCSLTTAPELPATTLATSCYLYMFYNCTSLTTAPELPATTLANKCYENMFEGCTSLTTAPELPATTLADNCYNVMFQGCTNLNYIKCLATDISANNCTYNWVNGVSSSGTFVKNPNMSLWTTGNNGTPNGWTVQDASA